MVNQYFVHILSPVTANCPFWISGRRNEGMRYWTWERKYAVLNPALESDALPTSLRGLATLSNKKKSNSLIYLTLYYIFKVCMLKVFLLSLSKLSFWEENQNPKSYNYTKSRTIKTCMTCTLYIIDTVFNTNFQLVDLSMASVNV